MLFARSPFYALSLAILFTNLNLAEWVDMPQFSDETKIYRIPSVQYDQFFKFRRYDGDHNFADVQRNSSRTQRFPMKAAHAMDDKKTEIGIINPVPESTTASNNLLADEIADAFTEATENRNPISINIENKSSDRRDATISPTKDTLGTLTTQSPSSTAQRRETPSRDEYYNRTSKQDNGVLEYLPVDVLKSVHRTLQSQPVSFEGKVHFLKMFEKTLMSEIESRLTTAMTASRKTRGADYYGHGYDDHDDNHSLGFPSIEGALMAISFLTFAVYLVRLVMLLFRNINNPATTTTADSLFLGKRKRSVDLDDDAARILSNMNSFFSNF